MGKEEEQGRLPIGSLEGDEPMGEPLDPVIEAQGVIGGRRFHWHVSLGVGETLIPRRVKVLVTRNAMTGKLNFKKYIPGEHFPEADLAHTPLGGDTVKGLSFEDQGTPSLSTVLKRGASKTDWTARLDEQIELDGGDPAYRIPKQTATHIGPADPEHPQIKKRPESFFTNLGQIFPHKKQE